MYLFIRRLLKKVLPRQLLCSQKNEQVLLKGIQKLLSLGKFERCCLGEITSKIKTKDIKWFPRKLPHVAKEFLVAKVVHWIMDKFVFVILRSFFYITDSSVYRNRLFYYRKAVWSRLRKIAVQRYTSSGMLLEIPATEAQSLLTTGQVLGFAQLRLLPKRTSVRPIVNLGKRATIGPSKGLCINGQLQNILQVLTYIKSQTPELMGSSQFGASDIYTTWKKFVLSRQERQDSRQLYFVKVDIENCYDSIDQRKLFEIISKNLRQENSSEEYIIRRFATLHVANNLLKRIFRRDVTSLDQFEPDFTRFAKELCKSRDLTGVVFVDQVMHMHETNDHILEKLGKHLFNNVIQIGKKFYRQQIGISQGSILSTMLCNSYYGDMERKYLQAQEDELLMRQVDDFLLVTPYLEHAKDFLKFMKKGIPEYNCVISPSKTLVNFDPATTGFSTEEVKQLPENALFPWCGMLINPRTLEVMMDYTRCYGLKMTDIVSFDLTQKIGQTIQAKLFRGLTCRNWLLCLDPDITTDNTLTLSLFKLFYMSALKFHAFLQKLPPKQGLTENPVFFLNIISSLPQYLYNNIRLKSSFHRDSAVLSQNALHWLCVQAFHAKLSIHRSKYGRDFLKAVTRTRRQLEGKLGSTILKDFTNICSRTPEELSSGFLM